MLDRGQPLPLWGLWWNAMLLLRPAFSRLRTFLWFATIVAGLTVRVELLGVTSIVRALKLRPGLYTKLLKNFHSSALKLDRLSALWAQAALRLFPSPLRVNGRLVLVGDGIKIPKRGRKCRPSSSCISNRNPTPSLSTSWGIPCRLSACSYTRPRASSPCRSPCASTKVWYGPIATSAPCSTRCSACSISWLSRLPSTLSPMPTTPPARWRTACSSRGTYIANRPTTAPVSNAKCALIMPSSRPASSPRDSSNISPSLLPSSFGTRSDPGCEPFVPAFRHRSSSLQKRCARHFPNFSWVPQKPILSRNSSPIAKTHKICGFSAWHPEQNVGLLRQRSSP